MFEWDGAGVSSSCLALSPSALLDMTLFAKAYVHCPYVKAALQACSIRSLSVVLARWNSQSALL